jgi:hypothetical protein
MKLFFLSISILYYSESKKAEISEERMAKICHQEEKLEFLHTINVSNNDHVRYDVEYISNA